MRIAVANRSGIPVDTGNVRRLAALFLQKAGRRAGCRWEEISIVLANDAQIQAVNRDFLGHDDPTDVISFTYDSLPGEAIATVSGEIMVNAAMALRVGRRFGGSARELALYVAHGCDHLAGAEDNTPARRRKMRNRELRWLREAVENGLLEKWTTGGGSRRPGGRIRRGRSILSA